MKTVNINNGIHKELKSLSAIKEISLNKLIENILLEYIKNNDKANVIVVSKDGKIIKEYY